MAPFYDRYLYIYSQGQSPTVRRVVNRVLTNFYALIRELSGPRPLCRVRDIVSKPRIWNRGAQAVLLENRTTVRAIGVGKGCDLTYSTSIEYLYRRHVWAPNFIDLRYVEGLRYCRINLGYQHPSTAFRDEYLGH